MLIIIKDTA